MMQLGILFDCMAWAYSLAWSFSFYGQICENRRLKNVEGMNLDFAAINVHGFILYFMYNLWGYLVDQEQTGLILPADLLFATHALLATLYTGWQAVVYERGSNKLRRITLAYIGAQWIFLGVFWGLGGKGVISITGYFKLSASCLKYIPQLYWNYQRKSTFGWSIFNVLMDFTGGIFSFGEVLLRLGVDSIYVFNPVKMLLGLLTIIYDFLFILQHYCLYRERQQGKLEEVDSPSGTQMRQTTANQAQEQLDV